MSIIKTVVVTANKMKPFTHAFGPYIGGSHPRAVVSGFFVCQYRSKLVIRQRRELNRDFDASHQRMFAEYFGLAACFNIDKPDHDNRQGALADGLHGLNPRNTALFTPESKRRPALIERLVKQLVHGGNKASCISESIRQAHLGLFGFSNVNRSK